VKINWVHHNGDTHNAFFGEPKDSNYAAYVYPYEGGFLWEVRHKCRCCNKITLCRTGSARNREAAFRAVNLYMLQILHLSKVGHK
jgi:hypothetical protein